MWGRADEHHVVFLGTKGQLRFMFWGGKAQVYLAEAASGLPAGEWVTREFQDATLVEFYEDLAAALRGRTHAAGHRGGRPQGPGDRDGDLPGRGDGGGGEPSAVAAGERRLWLCATGGASRQGMALLRKVPLGRPKKIGLDQAHRPSKSWHSTRR